MNISVYKLVRAFFFGCSAVSWVVMHFLPVIRMQAARSIQKQRRTRGPPEIRVRGAHQGTHQVIPQYTAIQAISNKILDGVRHTLHILENVPMPDVLEHHRLTAVWDRGRILGAQRGGTHLVLVASHDQRLRV